MVKMINLFMIEIKSAIRYKIEIITWLLRLVSMLLPVIAIIFFGELNSDILPNQTNFSYFMFLLVSTCYWGFIENFWDAVFTLRRKMKEGLLEQIMLMPLMNYHLLLGWALKGMMTTIVQSFPLIILVCGYSSFHLTLSNALTILGLFVISILANYGLCLILIGISMIFKEADQIISILGNIAPFVCGLFFSINMLPKVFLPISLVFPFTWALDLIRYFLFDSSLLFSFHTESMLFLCLSTGYIIIGSAVYHWLINIAKKDGLSKF